MAPQCSPLKTQTNVHPTAAVSKVTVRQTGKASHFYCVPGHFKSHFLSFQGDKETYIMWAEDAVFWSMALSQAWLKNAVNFQRWGEGDWCTWAEGSKDTGQKWPLKQTVSVP